MTSIGGLFHARAQRSAKNTKDLSVLATSVVSTCLRPGLRVTELRQRQGMRCLCRYKGRPFSLLFFLILNLTSSGQQMKTNFLSETKAQKAQRMKWWEDARFGLF